MNWIISNLENALNTWNEKLAEIWSLITQSPQAFMGGGIWSVIVNIHGAVRAFALGLLVLFFVIGIVKTCGSFAELKKPEHAIKLFIRFALARAVVVHGLELMLALLSMAQGLISSIMNASGMDDETIRVTVTGRIVENDSDAGFVTIINVGGSILVTGGIVV